MSSLPKAWGDVLVALLWDATYGSKRPIAMNDVRGVWRFECDDLNFRVQTISLENLNLERDI
jgi:hypothetical protein